MSTRIIVDSTADLIDEYRKKVAVVPLTIHFGSEEYIDGVTIDHPTFYTKLVESEVLPQTSSPSPGAFTMAFEEAKEEYDDVVVITISSRLSGTYQSAVIASKEFDDVYVVDSGSTTIGQAALVEEAFKLLDAGMNAKQIASELEELKKKLVIVAVFDTLDYLHKGGRLSKSVAFVGSVLNIKPVASVIDGVIGVLAKARGSKGASASLMKEVEKLGGIDQTKAVVVGYTGLNPTPLNNFVDANYDCLHQIGQDVHSSSICPVIGTHAGPGALGIGFFAKEGK